MDIAIYHESNSLQDWESQLVNLGTIERHVQFFIGDKILEGEGKGYIQRGVYDRVSELTGIEINSLNNYVWTCKAIKSSTRVEQLTWTHHREVAKLPAPDQEYFLNEAVKNHWSVRELRESIRSKNVEYENDIEYPKGIYQIIYADPPWKYGNSMPSYFKEQANYYPLMTIDEICILPIGEITSENAVLFIWVTSPILEESFRVINSWGFKYKASFVWDKVKHNMGHYNSVRHEFLLVCVKGSFTPQVNKLFDSVQSIERSEHSKKPEFFREIIDTIYPNGRRIELFAREKIKNWDSYGNQLS